MGLIAPLENPSPIFNLLIQVFHIVRRLLVGPVAEPIGIGQALYGTNPGLPVPRVVWTRLPGWLCARAQARELHVFLPHPGLAPGVLLNHYVAQPVVVI